ncbi:sister chromatid cohesion protein-like protein Mis4 [Macroventuria anomochaeta]|uniref:Sister chromatid cohesion protein-like protein Mis4 n=1 Tax=Macroventuria anomochaeta TaxID=301207 RepID=A0ACB6S057_9PLEO|nr:sister chromatid cohesion protein-like protein Mis4 [Macroventuria anomochaeta]KAF2626783.1 sister chromatid cohesion protein-like protein Mis4 [Macroventuria anomochaeta]
MARHLDGAWHNLQGNGIPYRPPPTVDEAIPYSPFTSMIPFSLDIIPFPSAGPPTPPSILTHSQQQAAKRAVGILNDEINGRSTATHLGSTLRQLQALLNPEELPEYNFKSIPQLATPPSESPTKHVNGTGSRVTSSFSPFAAMLLKNTEVAFSPFGVSANGPPRKVASAQQATPLPQPRATPQAHTPNNAAYSQNAAIPYPSSALLSEASSTPLRPGTAVVIKRAAVKREEHQRFDNIALTTPSSQRKAGGGTAVLRPHEREIADRKIEELEAFVIKLAEERDDLDVTGSFARLSTADGEMNVMEARAMDRLSDKMANVNNLGRFPELPVDLIMQIQKLLEPSITYTGQLILFPQEEDWSDGIEKARAALQASKLVLASMIDGRDDYRLRPEDTITVIIDLIKVIRNECIMPVVQARRSDNLFDAASSRRKELISVLRGCGAVLSRFATLIGKVNLSERGLNVLEDLTVGLLVEQNSDSEKDSVFGIKPFELFRQKAMDVLTQIFARHAEQRPSILNGILSNLEKLPDKKASARQFKSAREAPIMSISALFMRFVQVAAMNRESRTNQRPADAEEQFKEEEGSDYEPGTATLQTSKRKNKSSAPDQIAQALALNANHIANTITSNLVDRASNVSKTGDKPFRNLLDLFIEDFCNVLGSPEWPAAAILLTRLLVRMYNMVQGEPAAKQTVVDKDMALSTMAKMGCGVIDFKHRLKQLKRGLDASQSELSTKLYRLADDALTDNTKESINPIDLYEFDGPCRMVIESLSDYLELQRGQEDPHLESVTGCHVTLWLDAVVRTFKESSPDAPRPQAADELQRHLEAMIMDSRWLDRKYKFQVVSENQAKLAAGIVTLQADICTRLPTIVQLMLVATRDKVSSKLRSRGMTGLEQLIEKDPRVVNETTVGTLVLSLKDSSPMVREHTLGLVAQCLEHEPSLERRFLEDILQLTTDSSNGPKKKAIKLLKGLYTGTASKENKLNIAIALLLPSQDDEKAIAELSRSVLEELWMTPLASAARTDEHQVKLDRAHRASLMTDVVQRIHKLPLKLEAFEKFLAYALSGEAKARKSNIQLCKELIAEMFDKVIEVDSTTGEKSPQAKILGTLSIFAKVDSTLFTMAQVDDLKIHIIEPKQSSELAVIQPIVRIFRHVFPTLPFLDPKLAEHVRANLMRILQKLAWWASQGHVPSRDTLTDVAHCLWTICPLVDLGLDKLFTAMFSTLCSLRPLASPKKKETVAAKPSTVCSFLVLLGTFGKVCAFNEHTDRFIKRLAPYARDQVHTKKKATEEELALFMKGSSSVSLLLLETVRPFTMQIYDMSIREHALRSLGGICQQAPELFMRKEVEKLVEVVFINQANDANQGNNQLALVVLSTFEVYFTRAERRSETGSSIAVGEGAVNGSARLESSYAATATDAATTHVAKKFLRFFKDIALKNNNELAETATSIIASISRAGLEHPKECGAALVALSTSSNYHIAQVAAVEHKRIHEKQESYLEKEYVQAVRMAFEYQRDVFDDSHGMLESKYSPKLTHLFDALKGGKKATFKKFVDNLSKQLDFDFAKLKTGGAMPDAVLFARFCLENLGLVDFTTLDMVASFIDKVEAIVLKDAGPLVAGEIDKEMPQPAEIPQQSFMSTNLNEQLQAMVVDQGIGQPVAPFVPIMSQPASLEISDDRLRKFTVACMILHMIWETRTFVRRCYNVHKYGNRIPQKEYAKPAQRNNFINGKDLWDRLTPIMGALDSRETMIKCCYDFSELLNVDREVKVGEDEDGLDAALMDAGYETPTENGDDARRSASIPTSGRGRKRKSNVSLGNTPKKSRGRLQGAKNKKRSSRTPDDDDDSD